MVLPRLSEMNGDCRKHLESQHNEFSEWYPLFKGGTTEIPNVDLHESVAP